MIHLDSTFAIDLMREARRGDEGPATRFLSSLDLKDVVISLFVQCELYLGAELSQRPDQIKGEIRQLFFTVNIVHPDERFPPIYARILSALRRSGRIVDTMDVLIGTLAVVEKAPVVTRNLKDFERIPDLEVLSY